MGVTEAIIEKFFIYLDLPPLQFLTIESEVLVGTKLLVKTQWRKIDDNRKLSIYIEMIKERGKWHINFFYTFRRFCALKLYLHGFDKIEAFEKSRQLAIKILKSTGVIGYVTEFGTIRSFENEFKGIITP